MAVLMPRSCFLHVPKTGGTWVRKAIAAAGIPHHETAGDLPHIARNHATYDQAAPLFEGRYVFAFVRHPLDWYQSFWCYRMQTGFEQDEPFDEFIGRDFNEFVVRCCQARPGLLTEFFEGYTGWPMRLDFCGHTERLADGLIEALTAAGESFDASAIRALEPQNVAQPHHRRLAEYRDEARDLVLRSETAVIERYGY